MKRIGLGLVLLSVTIGAGALVGGCGHNSNPDMNNGLPDGFVSNNCSTVDDCSPTSCQTAKCNPVTHMCQYTDKVCDPVDDCNVGMCDPSTANGDCTPMPANEGMACTTTDSVAGACMSGVCTPVPSCAPMGPDALTPAECDSADLSLTYSNNSLMSFGGAAAVLNSYAGCAPTENGPEIAFALFHDSTAGDEDITVKLTPLNDDDTPASADDKDLDLIVLEDNCTGTAKCMNPMLSGGGYAGVTAGTANERVTFHATAGKQYYIVVDGKDMNQTREFVVEVEACGKCQPTDSTRLSCNMTMPITVNTANGAAQLTDYMCGAAMTAVSSAGKEVPLYFRTDDGAVRNVTATLTGATQPYNMFVLPTTFWGQCDPTTCIDNKSGAAAANNSITWKVDPDFNSFARYWVVVDAPNTTDTSVGVELSCAPYCTDVYDLACGGGAGTETPSYTFGDTTGGPTQATAYGPSAPATGCDGLTGMDGPENAIGFTTDSPSGGVYRVLLVGKSAGKNLSLTVVDAGTTAMAACDPSATCMTNTVVSGSIGAVTLTGTRTTNGTTAGAAIQFTAAMGHQYYFLVDGTAASEGTGAQYSLQVIGQGGGAGCP